MDDWNLDEIHVNYWNNFQYIIGGQYESLFAFKFPFVL